MKLPVPSKLLSALVSVSVAASLGIVPAAPVWAANYADGTYTGSAPGYDGNIVVEVTIENGAITAVTPIEFYGETLEYWDPALRTISEILEAQSPEVDAVTGATASSNGIKFAVAAALAQADTDEAARPDADIFASGQGTQEDPFIVETKEQLLAFGDSVTMTNNYTGYYISLGADIDISGENWEPIGGADAFNGTLNGGGHTISGLTMGSEEEAMVVADDVSNVGFFGNLGGSAVIENLRLTDVMINIYQPGLLRVGALAGASGRRDGVMGPIIDSVDISGSVTVNNDNGNIWAGGYVGMLFTGSVINCVADVDVFALSSKSDPSYRVTNWVEAGGITGLNFWGEIVNSVTLGDVTGGAIRREPDEATAADNADALENGPVDTEEISVAICAVGGISGLDLGHTENVYTAGNVSAISDCNCISSTVGFSEETHSDADYEYTHLDHVYVSEAVSVDNNGESVAVDAPPRYEEGAEIGSIAVVSDSAQILDELNQTIASIARDEAASERMRVFGSRPSMLKQWVMEGDLAVPRGDLLS